MLFQVVDDLADAGINVHAVLDQAAGVQHGAVVAAAEGLADFAQGGLGHGAGEEHRNLTRESDVFRAALAGHVCQADIEVFGHLSLNGVNAD